MNTVFDTFPRRSLSGTGLGPNSGFSHSRDGFNDDFSGYVEVSGLPNYPPPLTGLGRSPFSSMSNPNIPPPASLSQSYPSSRPGPLLRHGHVIPHEQLWADPVPRRLRYPGHEFNGYPTARHSCIPQFVRYFTLAPVG